MMKIKNFLCLFFIFLISASCSKNKVVPILQRGKNIYSKDKSYDKNKYAVAKNKNGSDEKEIKLNKQQIQSSSHGANTVVVAAGDNLYSISRKYNIPLREIIDKNQLVPPYALKVGSTISIPSSTYHEVQSGETLYSVARKYNMPIQEVVILNDLKSPYQLNAGQKVKISNAYANVAANKVAANNNKSDKVDLEIKEQAVKTVDLTPKTEVEKISLDNKNNKFSWPIFGSVISKFGPKNGGLYNDGINIQAAEGSVVKASEDGLVAYVGNELKGYGNLVILKHSGGWISAYAHLSKSVVKRGDRVAKGQGIGNIGATGNVDAPQLYFGLRKGREAVNPENYLLK